MSVWEIDLCVFDVRITTDSPCIHLLSRVMTIYIFEFEGLTLGTNIPDFYEIITAPITKVCYSLQKVWHISHFSTSCNHDQLTFCVADPQSVV